MKIFMLAVGFILSAQSVFADPIYLVLAAESAATGENSWFAGEQVSHVNLDELARNARAGLVKKLRDKCINKYHGAPADVVCLTDEDESNTDWEGYNDGGTRYRHSAEGKMYCRVDVDSLSWWTRNFHDSGTSNFSGCKARLR